MNAQHRRRRNSGQITDSIPPRPLSSQSPDFLSLRYGWIVAAATAFLIYLPALGYEFTLDDALIVMDNPRIRWLDQPQRYLLTSWWNLPGQMNEYRPATMASFALNFAIHGDQTFGFHLVNNVLHAANAALFWCVACLLLGNSSRPKLGATVSAIIFAVHPIHVEAVAGIVGRAELMMTFGLLTSVIFAALAQISDSVSRRLALTLGAAGCGALAVFSKEQGIILPAIALLLVFIPVTVRPHPISTRIRRVLPVVAVLAAIVVAYLIARGQVLGNFFRPEGLVISPRSNPLVLLEPFERRLAGLGLLPRMVGLLLFPILQSPDYSPNILDVESLKTAVNVIPGAFLLCSLILAFIFWRNPAGRFAVAVMIASLALGSNMFITIGTIFGERLLYLPSIGFCLLLGVAAADFRVPLRGVIRATAIWAFGLLVLHSLYLPAWRNDAALFTMAFRRYPESGNVKAGYSLVLRERRELILALSVIEDALRISPYETNWQVIRALLLAELRRDDEALPELERLVILDPGNPMILDPLATILSERGEIDRAEVVLRAGIEANPDSQYNRELLAEWLRSYRPESGARQ